MKPHEATLKDEKCSNWYGERAGDDHFLYASDGDEQHVACIPYDAPGGPEQWVRLFQGAKGMAEALLSTLSDNGHIPGCPASFTENLPCGSTCSLFRSALRDAGVIP